jgi:hypothetical protein
MGIQRALVLAAAAGWLAAVPAGAAATPARSDPGAEVSPERQQEIRRKVDGLFAGLVEELDRGEARRHRAAVRRGERLGDLTRGVRLLALAAGHLQRGAAEPAARIVAEVEGLLAAVAPDRGHFAGERVAEEAANARRAAGLAREAIEAGNRSRGLAAVRLAGRYAARARDVAAASALPLFEE